MKNLKHLMLLSILLCFQLRAQTLTDGFMMTSKSVCTGFTYSHDSWKEYWQGSKKRENGNIGTVTTQNVMWMATYGITDKLNVIAMVPYVWTNASSGTLHPMQGVQDLTLGVKYRFLKIDFGESGSSLRFFGLLSGSVPLTNYTPDFLPLSIGVQSKTVAPRLTAYYVLKHHWYANISGAYNFRSNITLDRPSYYSDDQFYSTNVVAMPNQFLVNANIGYKLPFFWADINYSQQNTLGGGDIRPQDMPFASNRMNFVKLGVTARYYFPYPRGLSVEAMTSYTVLGRNVGQSTTYSAGLQYTFIFKKDKTNFLL